MAQLQTPRPFTGMSLDRASEQRKDPAEVERWLAPVLNYEPTPSAVAAA